MRIARLEDYARVVSNLIESTNDTGTKMGVYFTPLKKVMQNDDFSDIDLSQTKKEFQSGTNVYKQNLKQLNAARVPAKVLGKHKMMISDYSDYVDACQAMVDSIDPQAKKVNHEMFTQSEKKQDSSIVDFIKYTRKLMLN